MTVLLPFSALSSLSVLPGFLSATIFVFIVLLILFVIVKFCLMQFYLTLPSPVYFLLLLSAFFSGLLSVTCFFCCLLSFCCCVLPLSIFLLLSSAFCGASIVASILSFNAASGVCFLLAFFFKLLSFS